MLRFDRDGFKFSSSVSTHTSKELHYDLLSFLSIAVELGVDLLSVSSQPALGGLGNQADRANSSVDQASVDRVVSLAFKRVITEASLGVESTDQIRENRFKALISELLILECLQLHPNVIDLVGVFWTVGPSLDDTWPVLVTEKSDLGSLADYMKTERSKMLTFKEKWSICLDVARAITAMHTYGIIHGDIKCENVLLFLDDSGVLRGKVIDFGFSCFGSTDHDMVQPPRTVPWQAPEHDWQYFPLPAARKMDIYSFGMLLWSVMLSGYMPSIAGVDRMEELKSNDGLYDLIQNTLDHLPCFIDASKVILKKLFSMTLRKDPSLRTSAFDDIVEILEGGSGGIKDTLETEGTFDPLSMAHEILEIQDVLGDLDDMDYLVREALVRGLRRRTDYQHGCEKCRTKATYQLGLCLALGLGVKRNESESDGMISTAISKDSSLPPLKTTLSNLEEKYEASEPLRLFKLLGYGSSLPFDPSAEYEDQNRLEAAASALRREIDDREACLGKHSKSRLSLMILLGRLLSTAGKFVEAEGICREASQVSSSFYGDDHALTVSCQNYLINTLWLGKRFDELEILTLSSIEMKTKTVPTNDASLLNSKHTLGCLYYEQGRYQPALDTLAELVEVREGHIGPNHPETLLTKSWLVRTLKALGRIPEALEMQGNVVEGYEKVHGPEYEGTFEQKAVLAGLLLDSDRLEELQPLSVNLVDRCAVTLGRDHPITIIFIYVLAKITAKQGSMADAVKAQEDVVQLSMSTLGKDDTDTLERMSYLGDLYEIVNDFGRAEDIIRKALARYSRIYGIDHPETLAAMNNLANVYAGQGKLEEAELLQRQVLEKSDTLLGKCHPDTLDSMGSLANMLIDQHKDSEAALVEEELAKRLEQGRSSKGVDV